jgi:hypothetical protein
VIVVPLTLREANVLVARHHKPILGHRYSIGCEAEGRLVGAAIVGRPAAKSYDQYREVEVRRLVTDGTKNACSMLYAAAARIAREMGFTKIQTYILDGEPGVSLKAAGWSLDGVTDGGQWDHNFTRQLRLDSYSSGHVTTNRVDQPTGVKQRWIKVLHAYPGNSGDRDGLG